MLWRLPFDKMRRDALALKDNAEEMLGISDKRNFQDGFQLEKLSRENL